MQVNLRSGGGGEYCWNVQAIQDYVARINDKEARLASNPDISVISGKIACTGCVVNVHGNGAMCTAQLTETQFAVIGERPPRPEDAFGSMYRNVPGYEMVLPGSGRMARGYVAPASEKVEPEVLSQIPSKKKHGLLGLFSSRSRS